MIVKMLLNSSIQLTASENPISPNIKVTNNTINTIFNGWVFSNLVKNSTISLDDTDIKNNAIHIKENINDQRLNFIFINILSL